MKLEYFNYKSEIINRFSNHWSSFFKKSSFLWTYFLSSL